MIPDPHPPDKIQLLMEETSCDRAEAELAMSLAGFDLEKAIRTIGSLLRHIVVVKGKFVDGDRNLHGLLILIADTRREHLFRARAVVSYNPGLHETSLDHPWYEFERSLYAARLGEGALQQLSQDLERAFTERLESQRDRFFSALKSPQHEGLPEFLNEGLSAAFPGRVEAVYVPEVIDWDQFHRFPIKGEERAFPGGLPSRPHPPGENLALHLDLMPEEQGVAARDIRVGDTVTALLADGRDIAQYLAKLFGAMAETGPRPFEAPVETLRNENGRVRFHLRISAGILGVAEVSEESRVRVRRRRAESGWRRWLGVGNAPSVSRR
ncbi:MAG: hypothetical protein IPP35_11515 [Elusimicrobia bacterium]|nr:hypothetical protein [Elusimicrobiota bacterium]